MTRTQIFVASTLYGAATLAAALDAGMFAPADRRMLLITNNAAVPETTPPLDTMPGYQALRARFDDSASWNEAISPLHPSGWSPRADDIPLWERHFRRLWDLGDDEIHLVVESIQVKPARSLVQLFPDASVDVYADGLMSYGPTRNKLEPLLTTRLNRLLHLDLVPGLRPLLLSEYDVPSEVVPTGAFTEVIAELASVPDGTTAPSGAALLLGQYLSALDLITADEEEELHLRMLRGAAALGHHSIVFKPHPTAPALWSRTLEQEAVKLGVELTVIDSPVLAEVLYRRISPALVVGCFSTALITASALYKIPAAHTGTDLLLERLSPYQNSNRVPVTIVDALLPEIGSAEAAAPPDLTPLLHAVGYCMQARSYPLLRDDAVSYLTDNLTPHTRRYFNRRRLASLALPGAVPARLAFLPRNPTARRVVRRARALLK